ncbi:MAG TPA: HIRAN domain-containing protein [Niabella sp.]|nr:HIRAN domain-containing protein [Niabella sp.]HQW15559.1 HIRAN domain-containing protein [Niabella sp.]HQX20702.1 HIRAN domain-containing protein [Niabella sp.]HQX40944.1 HIRAN domain-containing protein [Niabella sp.]HRB07185.1 HIRAN domain-containing protein [Niabella sp.]
MMRRSQFIRGIIGVLGVSALPSKMVKQYQRIYLLQSFVRGFRFYEGPKLLDQMQEGDLLQLKREPDNKFDDHAIALFFNNRKIGFLPQEDNEILSKLMDAEVVDLQAGITHLEKAAQAWENVHVAVFVLKELKDPLPETAKYLTVLETPHYHSLKLSEDSVVNIYYGDDEEEELLDVDDFFEELGKSTNGKAVKDKMRQGLSPEMEWEQMIYEGRLVVNKNKLPADLKGKDITHALKEGEILLNHLFDEEGFLVANVNEVARLSTRIDKVVEAVDSTGRLFYEIRFV